MEELLDWNGKRGEFWENEEDLPADARAADDGPAGVRGREVLRVSG